jgi:hypothetical protein
MVRVIGSPCTCANINNGAYRLMLVKGYVALTDYNFDYQNRVRYKIELNRR